MLCLGLVLVLVCGAELFTGNSLMVCALKEQKGSPWLRCSSLGRRMVGNFVGALFIVFLVYMAGIYKLNGEAVANSMVSVAAGKVTIDWVTIFFRGILCNIFVCLAVWIGTAGKTVVDKVVGILLPIAAFVACGFEHCVANMYFLPMGAVMHACGYGADVAGAMRSTLRALRLTCPPPRWATSWAARFWSRSATGLSTPRSPRRKVPSV